MTKKTSYLLGIVITIIIGTILYYNYCCSCSSQDKTMKAQKTPIAKTSSEVALNKFSLTTNGFTYQCADNFNFLKNDFKTLLPIRDSINLGIDNLKAFFDRNSDQKVLITGYTTSDEKNTSAYPNLGYARANDVKNYFVSKGLSASNFDTYGEISTTWNMNADTIFGPINFKIIEIEPSTAATKKTDWNALKAKINANPLVLYFKTGETDIILTKEQRLQVSDLVNYLDHVSVAKISAIGHTDNVGDRDTNTKIGLERADFARDYLIKNGVSKEKTEALSKGPDEPIANNKTVEGRAKNRRTVIVIK